ncbi:hypothetical protein SDC9_194789 [bioreactor metagenome]|uniref:SdpI/YhfL protein family protein n=1 Tax=bioreactor metagenome TaxID=1076179 RepID=A0A645I7F4_9ZZZZ
MSTKNQETWDFAHRYSGKVWIRSGALTFTISIIFIFALKDFENYKQIMLMLFYLQLGMLFLVIPLTEIALRSIFDKGGNKKQV